MNIKDIKKHEWYRLGAETVPLLIVYAFDGVYTMLGKDSCLAFSKKSHSYFYTRLDILRTFANNLIENQLKDKNHVDSIIKDWQNVVDDLEVLYKDLENIKKLNNEDLKVFLKDLYIKTVKLWEIGFNVELYDPLTEEVMQNLLDKYETSGFSLEDFNEVCVFDEPSVVQRRQLDLIKIQESNQKEKDELINQHLEEFKWIKTNFFESKLLTKKKVLDELDKKIEVDLDYYEKLKQKKQNTLAKYKPSKEILNIIDFFNKLSHWREIRKEQSLKLNYFIARIFEEIANRIKQPSNLLLYCSLAEFNEVFENKQEYIDKLKQRQKCWCTVWQDNKFQVPGNKEALPYIEAFESLADPSGKLKGTTACRGKVTAKVKVLYGEKDFPNFNKGDIIVALMTRPEFVPLMEKASAIITEEGGITCHASIISRELKIPCIVGVQNATTFLKDNDLVEVDAGNGTVRKVSDK